MLAKRWIGFLWARDERTRVRPLFVKVYINSEGGLSFLEEHINLIWQCVCAWLWCTCMYVLLPQGQNNSAYLSLGVIGKICVKVCLRIWGLQPQHNWLCFNPSKHQMLSDEWSSRHAVTIHKARNGKPWQFCLSYFQ